jgi:hypothetical protein
VTCVSSYLLFYKCSFEKVWPLLMLFFTTAWFQRRWSRCFSCRNAQETIGKILWQTTNEAV